MVLCRVLCCRSVLPRRLRRYRCPLLRRILPAWTRRPFRARGALASAFGPSSVVFRLLLRITRFRRLFGGFVSGLFRSFFFRNHCRYIFVFEIACQISLTPRPVTAEKGNSSPPESSFEIEVRLRCCSFWFNLSNFVATTTYGTF